MYLLDTDHLSVLERGGAEGERLRGRLQAVPPAAVAATVVSYEEQTRGWLSYLAKARSLPDQVTAYSYLQRYLQVFCAIPLLAFDSAAAAIVQHLSSNASALAPWTSKSPVLAWHTGNAGVAQRHGLSEGARAARRRLDCVRLSASCDFGR